MDVSPAAAVAPLKSGYARLPRRHRQLCRERIAFHRMIMPTPRVTILPEAIRPFVGVIGVEK
jgi:hypothetical protein